MSSFTSQRDTWLKGIVQVIKRDYGFIRPTSALPNRFRQKDVFFFFSAQTGPQVQAHDVVDFVLNPSQIERPAATKVKKTGWQPSSPPPSRRRGKKRTRSPSQPRSSKLVMEADNWFEQNQSAQSLHQSKYIDIKHKKSFADDNAIYNSVDDTHKRKKICAKQDHFIPRGAASTGHFSSRMKGRVQMVKDAEGFGFVKPSCELPEGYPEGSDIYFRLDNVENGGMPIRKNDVLEFSLGTQKKERPIAMFTKIVMFSTRNNKEIIDFLNKLQKSLQRERRTVVDAEPRKERDVLCRVLACEAVWICIGEAKDMPEVLVHLVIEMILLLGKKSHSMKHVFHSVVKSMLQTHFFNPLNGPLKTYINNNRAFRLEDHLLPVKSLLLLVVTIVPEKLPAIVTLIKPLVSTDNNSMDFYLYSLLRQSCKYVSASVDDMQWDSLPLVPTAEELTGGPLKSTSSLQPVKTKGPYESVEEYMDIYFRLLRSDCFSSLKEGVRAFLNGTLDRRDMNVYHRVKLVGIHLTHQDSGLAIAIQITPMHPVKNWATCSNLMFGNLLCLSLSGSFLDPIWATVVTRDVKLLQTRQIISVELCTESNMMSDSAVITQLSHGSGQIIAVESPTYYRAYQPVLKALQSMDPDDFPFVDKLVKVDKHDHCPDYIKVSTTIDSKICHGSSSSPKENLLTALRCCESTSSLDDSQFNALAGAMVTNIGVIQGPPGTGKTYIGIKIVDLILSMSTVPDAPILVLTYKNHALDEFLKEIVSKHPDTVARIGGRCTEPAFENCNLSELRKQTKRSQALGKLFAQKSSEADDFRSLVTRCSKALDESFSYNTDTLLQWATPEQVLALLLGCNWSQTTLTIPTKKSKRQITLKDVTDYLDNLKTVSKTDICNFLQTTPSEEDRECHQTLHRFIDEAFQQWYPSIQIVQEVEASLGTYSALELNSFPKVTGIDDEPVMEELRDEKDIEDMEKERLAASSHQVMKSEEIIEFHSGRQSKIVPCLFSTAKHVINKMPMAKVMNCNSLWDLRNHDRVKFIQCLLIKQVEGPQMEFEQALSQYQQICAAKNELEIQHSLSLLQSKRVIGMTITGASIHHNLLAGLQPAIVLVEEAAEVLEPQLIAALGKSVKHLILIGDHMQLRPPVESYKLRKEFNFDVSMMERLIKNDVNFYTLQFQNRMRPEMSELLLDIYPDLRDNWACVRGNKQASCLERSMFFWDHSFPEEGGRSYRNKEEADRAVRLSLFLMQQGFKPRQITILGSYQGQTALLRHKMREAENKYPFLFHVDESLTQREPENVEFRKQKIKIHTIDSYQGDENDIVIVSLVRSNHEQITGFLKLLNRRCVAQSRARCGLYIIGNSETVCSVKHWKNMVAKMDAKGCFGKNLTLVCPRHPHETKVKASKASDITLSSFCKIICNEPMSCNRHQCQKFCQPTHTHHYCAIQVAFTFDRCGHLGLRECSKAQNEVKCTHKCQQIMHCEMHICQRLCDPPHDHKYCTERVRFTYTKCGHNSDKLCSELEENLPCKAEVKVKHLICGQVVAKYCFQPDDKAVCKEPCKKILFCGHQCQNRCGRSCSGKSCKFCKDIAEEEEKRRRKVEKEALKKHCEMV